MSFQCRIELLGGLRVIQGDTVTERFQTQKTAILLAYLAYHKGKKFAREQVAELLWPDAGMTTIRNRLNQAVSSLRRQLHPPGSSQDYWIVADYSSVTLRSDAFQTDVESFNQYLALAASASSESERISNLGGAVAEYGGELLVGYHDDWILSERAKLIEGYYDSLSQLIKHSAASGDYRTAIKHAHDRLSIDAYDERSHRALMRLHVLFGQPRMALAQYETLDRLLSAEGLEPRAKTAEIYSQAKTAAESAPSHSIASKDETDPDGLDGLIESAAKSEIGNSARRAMPPDPMSTLPKYIAPFFGRETELSQIRELIEGGQRVITISGVGGVGKTRLAVEAGLRLAPHFGGRVLFVSLAELRAEDEVADYSRAEISRAFGLSDSSRESLIEFLLSLGPTLVICDSAEHVDSATIRRASQFVGSLPKLQLINTSRRVIGFDGEASLVLNMLPLPQVEASTTLADLMENPTVALLVNRARGTKHDFQLTERSAEPIVRLCRKLEGWPLAIELAAGWSRTLTVTQMIEHLGEHFDRLPSRRRDTPGRHRSLGLVLNQSFEFLSPELREGAMRLSFAEGGFDHELAEAMGVGPDTLDLLQSLGELSWLRSTFDSGSVRFSMLDSVRKFLQERAPAELRNDTLSRLSRYYVETLKPVAAGVTSRNQLAQDRLNCLLSVRWLLENNDPSGAVIVASAYLSASLPYSNFLDAPALYDLVGESLDTVSNREPEIVARLRLRLASTTRSDAAIDWDSELEKAIFYFKKAAMTQELCEALIELGIKKHFAEDYDGAILRYSEASEIALSEGLMFELSRALQGLTNSSVNLGNFEAARQSAARSVEAAQLTGVVERHASALLSLAGPCIAQLDYDFALQHVRLANELLAESGRNFPALQISSRLLESTCMARQGDLKASLPRLVRSITGMLEASYSAWIVNSSLVELFWQLVQCGSYLPAARLHGHFRTHDEFLRALSWEVKQIEYGEAVAQLESSISKSELTQSMGLGAEMDRKALLRLTFQDVAKLLETL